VKLKKLGVPLAWSTGAIFVLAGVAVLLWPNDEGARKTARRTSHEIPLKGLNSVASTKPTWPELTKVQELESKKDEAGLATIALAPSKPEDKEATRLRVAAIQALANVGSPAALKVLHDVLEDGTREVVYRMAAASALARRGSDQEVAYLKDRMANEPHKLVREKIRIVLSARGA
jgi:hypothetical protein